jgi:hypothetical protein
LGILLNSFGSLGACGAVCGRYSLRNSVTGIGPMKQPVISFTMRLRVFDALWRVLSWRYELLIVRLIGDEAELTLDDRKDITEKLPLTTPDVSII